MIRYDNANPQGKSVGPCVAVKHGSPTPHYKASKVCHRDNKTVFKAPSSTSEHFEEII